MVMDVVIGQVVILDDLVWCELILVIVDWKLSLYVYFIILVN